MNKYAFIVSSTPNYEQNLQSLLNSIYFHHKNVDIFLLSFGISEILIKKYPALIVLKPLNFLDKSISQEAAFQRFMIAYEVSFNYDAICLLDADMFLTANCDLFFDIAAKGFIVTGSNGMLINFNEAYQKKYNLDFGQKEYIYPKVHTTVPIFINRDNTDWFKKWYDWPRVDSFDDFIFLNMMGIYLGKDKKMLCMPPYTFTGIHHFQLKDATAIMEKEGIYLSGTEEQIYMVHGKWHWEGWLQDLWPTMEKYIGDTDIFWRKNRTKKAIQLLEQTFKKYYELSDPIN